MAKAAFKLAFFVSAFDVPEINAFSNPDTSAFRKHQKGKARMLTMQRMAELKANPKPSERRRRKRSQR